MIDEDAQAEDQKSKKGIRIYTLHAEVNLVIPFYDLN